MKKKQLKTLKLEKKMIASFSDKNVAGGSIPIAVQSAKTDCVQNRLCQDISLYLPLYQCR